MGTKLSFNPWTRIWIRPRETIRAIVQSNPRYMYPLLCFIYGLPMAFQLAQSFALGDRFSSAAIVIGSLILATLLGTVMINIATWLLRWTGKWIGGTGTYENIRAAVAWSNVPSVVSIAVWLVYLTAFGGRLFKSSFAETTFAGGELNLIFVTSVIQLAAGIWAVVIILKALGEVQGFSAWKALVNILIPIVAVFIGVTVLAWLVSLGAPKT